MSSLKTLRLGVGLAGSISPELAARLAEQAFLTPRRRPSAVPDVWAEGTPLAIPAGEQLLVGRSWGAGPVVLLVHGWAGHAGQLASFIAPLVRRGCRVVAFDAPAHGDSPGRQLTLVDQARAIIAAATVVAGRSASSPAFGSTGTVAVHGVIAHSFGGAATTVALAQGLAAERVAYVAPAYHVERTVRGFSAACGLTADAEASFRRRLEQRNHGYGPAQLDGPVLAPSMRARLLVVHDRQDREIPFADGAALAAAWPDATLLDTDGLGHNRILRDRAVVRAVADFLGVTPAAARPSLMETIERELFDRDARHAAL